MFKHSEYNLLETKKFIELTKSAMLNTEDFEKWNSIKSMFGIYTERNRGTYMLRPRFPAGLLNIEELEYFVNICEIYGEGRVHLTTRQDIQIHGLSIQNLIIVLELLLEKGYSSRSAGGHATRAIMTPPMSGFEEEIFDVTPYGDAITSFILDNPDYMGLPRKYKIALSNNEKNSLTAKVSDLGLLAVEVNGIKGFKVYGAGGLGANPKESIVLKEFLPKEDFLYAVEALKNLFIEHGDRENKARARIRFILQKFGRDEFIRLFEEHLNEVYRTKSLKVFLEDKKEFLEEDIEVESIPNLFNGRIKGRYAYYLHPTNGDLSIKEAKILIEGLKKIPYNLELRISNTQGLFIRNLKGSSIEEFKNLVKDFSKNELENSIACAGSTVCNLGILDSPDMLRTILNHFKDKKELSDHLPKLRISGCPNSCSAHHIGELGFWGKKKNGEPTYTLMSRGDFKGESIVLNKSIGEVKAIFLPNFLEDIALTLKEVQKSYEEYIKESPNFLEELLSKYNS